jgi:DNA-binding response OmpR family regulator
MRILVVEDDRDCLGFISEALGPLRSKLEHTDKLQDALVMVTQGFDAVWLDLALKDSSSDNTVEKGIPAIRALCPSATMIVVSGFGESMRDRALKAGADAYAIKKDLNGFNQASIAALLIQAAVHAMQRGANSAIVLERVATFFATLASSLKNTTPSKPST